METVLDGSYQPLSRPLFIYINTKSFQTKPYLKDFTRFYLENVSQLSKEVGYVPLPDEMYKKGLARLEAMQTGTVFGGHADVGVKLEDLFNRELKQ